jgi:hypothetical protein
VGHGGTWLSFQLCKEAVNRILVQPGPNENVRLFEIQFKQKWLGTWLKLQKTCLGSMKLCVWTLVLPQNMYIYVYMYVKLISASQKKRRMLTKLFNCQIPPSSMRIYNPASLFSLISVKEICLKLPQPHYLCCHCLCKWPTKSSPNKSLHLSVCPFHAPQFSFYPMDL